MIAQGLINEFHAVRASGTVFSGVNSSSDRVAGMNIVANSIEEFNEKQAVISRSVKVVDDRGNDMMRRDLLPPISRRHGGN